MAYDPKNYLQQALKTGFQDIYSPASNIDDSPRYEGSEARFGDVVVRPMSELVGQSEQDIGTPQQTGYSVSSPLSGKYAGYFRNDLYDNEGNFLRTTISEPDTDKYGFKQMAQMGLMAAGLGGFGPVAQGLSKAASGIAALKSGDPLRILSAAANIPGAGNLVPAELNTLMDYAGKAGQVQSALKGDPNAIFSLITGAAKSGALPKGLMGDVDISGADAIEGFFAPGGEGYAPSGMDPNEMAKFLEANVEDPGTIETLMQDYFPDLSRQTITTTAKQQPPAGEPPRSIRDVGPVTQIQPGEKLEGTDITTPDLSKNLPTVPGKLKLPTKQPDKPATQGGLDLSQLAFLLGMMQQKPKEKEEQQAASPFPEYEDLMYGLSSRYA